MKEYEQNDFRYNLIAEFQRIDELFDKFQLVFSRELSIVVRDEQPQAGSSSKMKEHVSLFAKQIFSIVESVFEKDQQYSDSRLKQELDSMNLVVEKYAVTVLKDRYVKKVHDVVKKVIVLFFPDLLDLSGNGFRLLDKYSKMYSCLFCQYS